MSVGIDHELHSGWELAIVDENHEGGDGPAPSQGQQ
jgi:hypothetical protein